MPSSEQSLPQISLPTETKSSPDLPPRTEKLRLSTLTKNIKKIMLGAGIMSAALFGGVHAAEAGENVPGVEQTASQESQEFEILIAEFNEAVTALENGAPVLQTVRELQAALPNDLKTALEIEIRATGSIMGQSQSQTRTIELMSNNSGALAELEELLQESDTMDTVMLGTFSTETQYGTAAVDVTGVTMTLTTLHANFRELAQHNWGSGGPIDLNYDEPQVAEITDTEVNQLQPGRYSSEIIAPGDIFSLPLSQEPQREFRIVSNNGQTRIETRANRNQNWAIGLGNTTSDLVRLSLQPNGEYSLIIGGPLGGPTSTPTETNTVVPELPTVTPTEVAPAPTLTPTETAPAPTATQTAEAPTATNDNVITAEVPENLPMTNAEGNQIVEFGSNTMWNVNNLTMATETFAIDGQAGEFKVSVRNGEPQLIHTVDGTDTPVATENLAALGIVNLSLMEQNGRDVVKILGTGQTANVVAPTSEVTPTIEPSPTITSTPTVEPTLEPTTTPETTPTAEVTTTPEVTETYNPNSLEMAVNNLTFETNTFGVNNQPGEFKVVVGTGEPVLMHNPGTGWITIESSNWSNYGISTITKEKVGSQVSVTITALAP